MKTHIESESFSQLPDSFLNEFVFQLAWFDSVKIQQWLITSTALPFYLPLCRGATRLVISQGKVGETQEEVPNSLGGKNVDVPSGISPRQRKVGAAEPAQRLAARVLRSQRGPENCKTYVFDFGTHDSPSHAQHSAHHGYLSVPCLNLGLR